MAYPQPGQYPAYPQYPGQAGAPAKPPIPQTVQNAFYLMIAGAVLQVVSGIATLGSASKIRSAIITQHPDYTTTQVNNAVHVGEAFAIIIVLIGMGLWIWMAFAIRAGKNWARITGTVFFGIESLSLIVGLAASNSSTVTTKASGFTVVMGIVIWLAGLATLILIWNKQSSAYFKPQGGPDGGYPAQYPYPYAAPGQQQYDQAPYGGQPPYGQQQPQPYPQQPQEQPPADPWSNPNPPQQ